MAANLRGLRKLAARKNCTTKLTKHARFGEALLIFQFLRELRVLRGELLLRLGCGSAALCSVR
jgi:hypothetical protein